MVSVPLNDGVASIWSYCWYFCVWFGWIIFPGGGLGLARLPLLLGVQAVRTRWGQRSQQGSWIWEVPSRRAVRSGSDLWAVMRNAPGGPAIRVGVAGLWGHLVALCSFHDTKMTLVSFIPIRRSRGGSRRQKSRGILPVSITKFIGGEKQGLWGRPARWWSLRGFWLPSSWSRWCEQLLWGLG